VGEYTVRVFILPSKRRMGNQDRGKGSRSHYREMQRYYESQQWVSRKGEDKKAAIHHKWMGKLLCDSQSKNSDAELRWVCTDEATDMPMEGMEETGNKGESTAEIRSIQT
jgi:hypothetical protein